MSSEPKGWVRRPENHDYDVDDVYASYKDLFTITFHHGGNFIENPKRLYVGGQSNAFDLIEHATFSMHELNAIIKELGYEDGIMYYHFRVPGSDLDNGLRPLGTDSDLIKMLAYVPKWQYIDVYVEHGLTTIDAKFYMTNTGGLIDEIDAELDLVEFDNPKCRKQLMVENVGEQSEPVMEPTRPAVDEHETPNELDSENGPVGDDNENGTDASDSETEGDDSEDVDFEPEKEVDNGDEEDSDVLEKEVVDDYEVDMRNFHCVVGMQGSKYEGCTSQIGELQLDDEIVGLNFDEFDSGDDEDRLEGHRKKRLKQLRRTMVQDPSQVVRSTFYVGQVFGSKKPVKEMVKLHAIDTRRDLKFVKDDKLRLRVRCYGTTAASKPRLTKGKIRDVIELLSSPEKKKEVEGKGKGVECKDAKEKGVVGESEQSGGKKVKAKPTCPWTLHVSKGVDEDRWMVKTLIEEHKCLQLRELRHCSSTFLSQQIIDTVDADPKIKGAAIQDIVSKRFQLGIKRMTATRARRIARQQLDGDYKLQYSRLRDYCLELQHRNPNTTVKIDVHVEANPSSVTRVFKRIYVCLGPLKEGFKACRRELLGFDGAFMKGPYPGQVLTAVGVDPNNGIYPLAYAVVEAETTESWTWFLICLREDLELSSTSNYTFISDRQKGLVPAIATIFPSAEHRFCVRHIYENMRGSFKGEFIREMLWKCATRTTIQDFDDAMEELRRGNEGAYKYLKAIPPKHWSRSHFTGRAHCDLLLNNLCESFNSKLVEGREKPIISCLEYIRRYLMKRIVIAQKVVEKCEGPLTPSAAVIFEDIKKAASRLTAIWNGGDRFQVKDSYREQCVVDIRLRTCTCRKWELTGLPCKHAVASMWDMALNSVEVGIPEDWVHPCYRLDTWKEVYGFKVEPISGSTSWPKSECPTKLLPPFHKPQVGRPKKQRKKSATEAESANMVKNGKLTRKGKTITCGKCGNKGHNSSHCKGQSQPSQSAGVKRTRKGNEGGPTQSQPSQSAGVKRTRKSKKTGGAGVSQGEPGECATQPLGTQ